MTQRIPAHQPDAILVQSLPEFGLGEVGMGFHLDELRNDFPFCLQFFDVSAFEVGNTDGPGPALLVCLLQLAVAGQPVARGLVDVEQICFCQVKTKKI